MRAEDFLLRLREQPDDTDLRLLFADWLEDQGDPRSELLRLSHALTRPGSAGAKNPLQEARLRALVASGVQPIGPCWTNNVGMRFTWVPPGEFLMGSPPHEADRQEDEIPHPVRLTLGFYLGVSPVTQAQWRAVMGDNPSRFVDDDRPVECVSWDDCQEFCRILRLKDGLSPTTASPYRLPTEAEWEFACRAGTTSPFFSGERLSPGQANYHTTGGGKGASPRSREGTTPSGRFPANAWGLLDMHGNVFEWCADWYSAYSEGPVRDPAGPSHGDVRVLRGGSWHSLSGRCRSACRGWGPPGYRGSDTGCRVAFRLESDFTL